MLKNRPKNIWNAQTITILGLMIALTIILTRVFAINLGPAIRLSLGSICTVLTGMWFGPLAGALAGAIADTIGLFITPGIWLPLITLSAAMWGVIPGLLTGLVRGSKRRRYGMICLIVVITSLVCQMGLTTIALVQLNGIGILPSRALQFAATTPIYCLVVCLLYTGPVTRMVHEQVATDEGGPLQTAAK